MNKLLLQPGKGDTLYFDGTTARMLPLVPWEIENLLHDPVDLRRITGRILKMLIGFF